MGRLRNIKPGFFADDQLAECSISARLLFIGLWVNADRAGRLEDRPRRIQGQVFPFDVVNVNALLSELAVHGFIDRYQCSVDGTSIKCIQVKNFLAHQKPHKNESQSKLPAKVASTSDQGCKPTGRNDESLNDESLNDESLNDESLNDESLNDELTPTESSPTCVSDVRREKPSEFVFPTTGMGATEWTLPELKLAEYLAAYPGVDVSAELRKARQWSRDNPRNRKTASGMQKFLTGWLNRANDSGRAAHAPSASNAPRKQVPQLEIP